jgi:hypothetical protein
MSKIVIFIVIHHGKKPTDFIPIQASKLVTIFAIYVETISCCRGTIMLSTYSATYLVFVQHQEYEHTLLISDLCLQ